MEFLTMDTDNRLTMFTHMIDKACGLGLWCFGMTRKLYSCTCAAEKEFRLFLDLGHCMDYAIEHAPESATPILLSDSIGMLWVAECVYQNGEPSFIIFMGPVFDAASSLKTLEDHLHGMNLSVSITIATMDKLNLVPLLPLPTLHQYIKMLHWVITEEQLDIANIRLQLREEPAPTKDTQDYLWDPNRARLLEKMIMQQIRDGTVCNFGADSGMARFAEKDAYNLGNPLRENKDAAIIFTALCSRAAMDGGLSPKISKQLEIQYVRAVEHCADMTSLMHINSNMVTDFTQRVHACKCNPAMSQPVQECCAYVQRHLLEKFRLSDLAKAVGYTEYYLTKKFRRETGQKLTDYINHARMQYACAQLTATKKTLQQISEELHYSSRSYFSAVFQKAMGCSPTDYRNRNEVSQ